LHSYLAILFAYFHRVSRR